MVAMDSEKPKQIESRYFFLKAVLYKKYPKGYASEVENFDETLDLLCLGCKRESVFERLDTTPHRKEAQLPPLWGGVYSSEEKEVGSRIFVAQFGCTRDSTHTAIFVFRVDDQFFMKIGEYPSLADRLYPELRKYEGELGDSYPELRMAVNLYSHKVGIGSFAYLRRVLEKVVSDTARSKYAEQPDWDLDEWRKSKKSFEERITDLSDKLPSFLVGNTSLYGILSKGIHDLEENECIEYFEIVERAIVEILDEKIRNAERDGSRDFVRGKLANIESKLGDRKT